VDREARGRRARDHRRARSTRSARARGRRRRSAPVHAGGHQHLCRHRGPGVFSPAKVDTVAIGAPLPDSDGFLLVIETDDANGFVDRTLELDNKQRPTTYHGVTYLSDKKGAIAAVDKHHLILARPDHIEAAIDVALGKRPSAAKSAAAQTLRDAVAATDTRHDVWMVMVPWDAVSAPLHGQGMDVTSLSIAAGISDALVLDASITCADAESARKLLAIALDKDKGMVVSGLQRLGLAGAIKTYEASRDGAVDHASTTLTQDDLGLLVQALMAHRHH
jgi:hypothetical protein